MSVWQDNAARFATTRVDVDDVVETVLANLERDLRAAAGRPRRRRGDWRRIDRRQTAHRQRRALAAATVPLERLARASGRAGVRTFEIAWRSR